MRSPQITGMYQAEKLSQICRSNPTYGVVV